MFSDKHFAAENCNSLHFVQPFAQRVVFLPRQYRCPHPVLQSICPPGVKKRVLRPVPADGASI